ncbi:MAG: T9SS type A sorting domain-containing protein [Bacteroidia bacterium]
MLVAVCTGLSPALQNESTLTLFYNPNNESLTFSGFVEGYDNLLLEIMDISGKVVSTYALMPSKENDQSVSIRNLSGGIYIARVLNGTNSNALKFIVFN